MWGGGGGMKKKGAGVRWGRRPEGGRPSRPMEVTPPPPTSPLRLIK